MQPPDSSLRKRTVRRRWILTGAALAAAATTGILIARHAKAAEQKRQQESTAKAKKKKKPRKVSPIPGNAEICDQLRELAEGKAVRVVWVEDRSVEHSDTFTNTNELRLVGFDSEAGGYAPILEGPRNFSRPLLTPDGEQVIYTDKNGRDGAFHPKMRIVDFDGENDRELGDGFCVDVARDPQTGGTVVYALETLNAGRTASIDGERLFRFQLNGQVKREPIWDHTPITVDNLQFSRDGRRFGALFPWPEGGIADPANGGWQKLASGCWASLAPDNSHLFWMFSGTHKRIRLFDTRASRDWNVTLSDAPGVHNHQVYHPRWANHPLFLTMTGPYPTKVRGRKVASGNVIAQSGQNADVFVGRFTPKLDRVQTWVRLTSNTWGDFYPDAWIEDGDEAALTEFAQAQPQDAAPPTGDSWPAATTGLQFVWKNAQAKNQIAGRHLACRAIARGIGRFAPQGALLLDGGWFETDEVTEAELGRALATSGSLTMDAVLTSTGGDAPLRVAALTNAAGTPVMEWWKEGNRMVFRSPAGGLKPEAVRHAADIPAKKDPVQISFVLDAGKACWTINGTSGAVADLGVNNLAPCAATRLVFGQDADLSGSSFQLQNIALYSRTLTAAEGAANLAAAEHTALPPAPRLRFKGRLLEATEPDKAKLASYRRMLVDHVYEVTEVLEGKTDLKQIVVLHWGVLDRELVPGIPREINGTYELLVEPASDHPELDSELTDQESLETETFLDVSPPARPVVK